MSARSDLPPRLRNWKKGHAQVGAFIRTRNGATISLVNNTATDEQEVLLLALTVGTVGAKGIPADIMGALRAWVDREVNRTTL